MLYIVVAERLSVGKQMWGYCSNQFGNQIIYKMEINYKTCHSPATAKTFPWSWWTK
jgi:hypothetical protein